MNFCRVLLAVIFLCSGYVSGIFAGDVTDVVKHAVGEPAKVADEGKHKQIIEAISSGNGKALEAIIEKDSALVNLKINGMPLLNQCIKYNNLNAFNILLANGADINAFDSQKRTPLIYAAQLANISFVDTIINSGDAKVNARDGSDKAAFDYARDFNADTAKALISAGLTKDSANELVSKAEDIARRIRDYNNNAFISEDVVMSYVPRSMQPLVRKEILGLPLWRYAMTFIIILLVLLVNTIGTFLIKRFSRKMDEAEEGDGKRSFIGMSVLSARRAFRIVVWGVGLYFVFFLLMPDYIEHAEKLSEIIFSIALAFFLYDYTYVFEYYLQQWANRTENKLDDMLVMIFRRAIRMLVIIIVGLHLYQTISGNSAATLIAGLGIGSMAVALAATDTLKNVIGFIMIILDKPFAVGERVKFGEHDGVVETIGMRNTRIRRLDGHLVSIPNSTVVSSSVHNIGRRPYLKRTMEIGLTYDTPVKKVEKALDIVRDILNDHEGMVAANPPRVYFTDLAADNLTITAIYWYFPADWYEFQALNEKVNLELMRRFEDEGIEFAFPTQTVYLADDVKRRLTIRHENMPLSNAEEL